MKISGKAMLEGSREDVWALIFDPRALRHLIPGCETLVRISETEYRGKIRIGVASIAGIYDLEVALAGCEPPQALQLEGVITGSSGVISGTAELNFEALGRSTSLGYTADAVISGPISRVSPRLLEGVVKALLEIGIKNLNAGLRAGRFARTNNLPLAAE